MPNITVASFYRFVALDAPDALRGPLLAKMREYGVRGTVLLGREGINATVAGSAAGVGAVVDWLREDPRLAGLQVRAFRASRIPFGRARVRLKKEIVSMGRDDIDPANSAGTYVDPHDWNALVDDPAVTLIDTRNHYEVAVGSFANAIDPGTNHFREFPAFVRRQLDPGRHKKIAMFCTGGIRCEKSTAYLKQLGFADVYHLKGGILHYLEQIDPAESRWHGECFVFDERVTVDHSLRRGSYEQCYACRMPLSSADRDSENYLPGISCPHCHGKTSVAQRAAFAERRRQVELAERRGESHVGGEVPAVMARRRANKAASRQQKTG